MAKHERNTAKLEGMIVALQLEDLKLDNIDAVDPLMLSIQVCRLILLDILSILPIHDVLDAFRHVQRTKLFSSWREVVHVERDAEHEELCR